MRSPKAVESPGSKGDNVVKGCSCKAGFSGGISGSGKSPYYAGLGDLTSSEAAWSRSCVSVDCPAHSEGANVPTGCSCEAGYSGSIKATESSPFYSGMCVAVACPENAAGSDLPSGCSCKPGFKGAIAKSKMPPYYTGSCEPVACPSNSRGQDVASGCSCLAGQLRSEFKDVFQRTSKDL